MGKKSRFLKPACLVGTLVASALSLGVFLPNANADIPVQPDPASDPYNTGTSHITIVAGKDTANPALYPNRFHALQIFQGKVPESGDDVTENTLTAITWGKSIDPDTLIKTLATESWGVGNANEDAFPTDPGVDELDYDNYKDIHSLGDLFARWCVDNVGAAAKAYSEGGSSSLEPVKSALNKDNVSALTVASFLQQFATVDGNKTEYSSPSKFTASEVAAGFAYVASNSQVEEDTNKWTSYAFHTLDDGSVGTKLAKGLMQRATDDFASDTWVIDTISGGFDPATGYAVDSAESQGIPVGYYVLEDTLSGDPANQHSAISELILRVVDNDGLVLKVKSDVPTVDKKIKGVDTDDNHDASVEATSNRVQYILTASLPENVMSYHDLNDPNQNKYMINFHDQLPDLFNIDCNSLHVYVNVSGNEIKGSTGSWSDADARRDITSDGKTNPSLNEYRDTLGQDGNTAIEVDLNGFAENAPKERLFIWKKVSYDKTYDSESSNPGGICDIHIKIPNVFNLKPKNGDTPIEIGPNSLIYVVYEGNISDTYGRGASPVDLFEQAVGSTSATEQLKNTVYLEYSNNPYNDGTGQTPEDSVQHYLFGVDLVKFENDFGPDNPVLKGAGFSLLQATKSGDHGVQEPALAKDDTDDFSKVSSVKVAWFKPYVHSDGREQRGVDYVNAYDEGETIYVFAGWHDPVLADDTYVKWYMANADNPTSHMHKGMLVDDVYQYVDEDGSVKTFGDHTGDAEGIDAYDVDATHYTQIAFTNKDGKAAILGLGSDCYTIIESLTPEAHKTLAPYTWAFETSNTSESKTEFTVYNTKGEAISDSEQVGDAKLFRAERQYLQFGDNVDSSKPEEIAKAKQEFNAAHPTQGTEDPYTKYFSPYEGQVHTTLWLRNVTNIDLPTTGGIGTTMLYIAGAILVLGGAAYIIYRRRNESIDEA